MSLCELVFTGFNRHVVALDRETGQVVWQWAASHGSGYTTLLLDGDRLIVSVMGYTYALDALTGRQLWMNELAGFRCGVASLVSMRGCSQDAAAQMADYQSKASS